MSTFVEEALKTPGFRGRAKWAYRVRGRRGGKATKKWIKPAIKKKGALRKTVQQRYGAKGFKKKDSRKVIKKDILQKLAKEKGVTGKRARLAITLSRLRK